MTPNTEIVTLHKYFLNADRMRRHFDQLLEEYSTPTNFGESVEYSIYMSLWYGCLRVVIEGWIDLNLTDPKVDSLMDNDKIAKLKGVRNDTFHFQKAYVPNRTLAMLKDKTSVAWVRTIHLAIGEALLSRIRRTSDVGCGDQDNGK